MWGPVSPDWKVQSSEHTALNTVKLQQTLWGSAARGGLSRLITGIAEIGYRTVSRLVFQRHHCGRQNSCQHYWALLLYDGHCADGKGELWSREIKLPSAIDTCFSKAQLACDIPGSEGVVPRSDAHHCSTAHASTSLFLLPSTAAWPCSSMPSYLSLPPSLSFISTTLFCS